MVTSSQETGTTSSRLGEVVEATSTGFTVNCYNLFEAAPLGALVHTSGEAPVYAVVSGVETVPLDPTRKPVARGQDEPDQEAVYRSNPQLPRLLRTDFQATIVGHQGNGGIRYYLPSQPPRIHAFVYECEPQEMRAFTERLDFLPLLLTGAPPLTDEVAAAFLRQAATAHDDPNAFLLAAGRQVALRLSRDYQRLNTLLRSLQQ
ncbi:MAG: hypothetical protein V3S37_07445 [Dehalococcoidia bacterium]